MFSVGQLAALARNLTVDDLWKLDDPNAFDWSAAFAVIKNADAGCFLTGWNAFRPNRDLHDIMVRSLGLSEPFLPDAAAFKADLDIVERAMISCTLIQGVNGSLSDGDTIPKKLVRLRTNLEQKDGLILTAAMSRVVRARIAQG